VIIARSFVAVCALLAQAWIRVQHAWHIRHARPLSTEERSELARHYHDDLLSAVLIRMADNLGQPALLRFVKRVLALLGIRLDFDFRNVSGITFDNCVLVRRGRLDAPLLFHELVHAEQYHQLGVARFARAYIQGLVDSRFVYRSIPLEVVAYDMTARFASGAAFSVRDELTSWIRAHDY
jgi:hypothetical protein